MAYYYVKSGGTATGAAIDSADGIYTSQLTGAWSGTASEYFDNLYDATQSAYGAPADGDVVIVSDAHAETSADITTVLFDSGTQGGAGIRVVSVDDSNRENYSPGAQETYTGARVMRFRYNVQMAGVSIISEGLNMLDFDIDCNVIIQDCTMTGGTTTGDDFLKATTDGANITFVNVELGARHATNAIELAGGATFRWYGGSVSGGLVLSGLIDINANAAGSVEIHGVDLSQVGTIMTPPVANDDNFTCKLYACQLRPSVTLPTLFDGGQVFAMYNCDDSTGNDYHRFIYSTGNGSVANNDSTYVTNTKAWYGSLAYSSLEVITAANTSTIWPFVFEYATQYADLADAGSNVATIELVTAAAVTLTDTDIAAFLVYPDGTTAVTPVWVTSGKTVGAGNYGIDPLAAGTALTTGDLNAADWTGEPASPNFYKLVLDTSATAGQATALAIRIEVYKPSIAAGELYMHPLLELS